MSFIHRSIILRNRRVMAIPAYVTPSCIVSCGFCSVFSLPVDTRHLSLEWKRNIETYVSWYFCFSAKFLCKFLKKNLYLYLRISCARSNHRVIVLKHAMNKEIRLFFDGDEIFWYSKVLVCVEVVDEKYKLYKNRASKYLFPRL